MRLSDENTRECRRLTPEERIALQAEEIKQLWQENEQLRARVAQYREALTEEVWKNIDTVIMTRLFQEELVVGKQKESEVEEG